MTRTMTNTVGKSRCAVIAPAVLILLHGIGEPGQLEFPEHPGSTVTVPGALGIVLVILESEWARMCGQSTRNRGWLNKYGMHEAYSRHRQVSAHAVGKYAIRLIAKVEAAFPGLDDLLLERDRDPRTRRGTHLVRDLDVQDFTNMRTLEGR